MTWDEITWNKMKLDKKTEIRWTKHDINRTNMKSDEIALASMN